MDKKYLRGRSGFVVLSIFFVSSIFILIPKFSHAQTSTYPILNFTLDTLGKTVLMSDTATDRSGDLKQYTGATVTQDWSINYSQKGSSRQECRPPVLNVTFSSGNPQGKFHGLSTYGGTASQVKYKKARLIPECDIWNDYSLYPGVGFNGQLNVSLREYSIFKIFRAFGVPTTDIIGFANVDFVTPDPGYAGQKFRYMMVSRYDDSAYYIPFTTQYNLQPTLYESSDIEGGNVSWTDVVTNRLTSANIVNKSDNSIIKQLSFDPDTSIRFFMLTDFLGLSDMAPLHNEDWGINNATGKAEIVPHGFDASYSCDTINGPSNSFVETSINQLSSSTRATYQTTYYGIARGIFDNSDSLNQMIALVNQFPYNDVDKSLLIEYLKIKFYAYATYYNSAAFASTMNQVYRPIVFTLPFASDQEYQTHLAAFSNNCALKTTVPAGVTATVVGSRTFQFTTTASDTASVNFTVDVKNGDQTLNILKHDVFANSIIGDKGGDMGNSNNKNISLSYTMPVSGVVDYPGPYYHVSPNATARFQISGTIRNADLLPDVYHIRLKSFQPNYKTTPLVLNADTNSLPIGSMVPIKVNSPANGDSFLLGSTTVISWSGSTGDQYAFTLRDQNYNWYYINNPSAPSIVTSDNEYSWTVGKAYAYNIVANKYVLTDLNYGQYVLTLQDYTSNQSIDSGQFSIIDKNAMPLSARISGFPKLAMTYNPSQNEDSLTSTFKVTIDAGSNSRKIPKYGAFNSYIMTKDGYNTWGMEQYADPGNVISDNDFYTIPANSSADFTVTNTYNPRSMFAGIYYGIMDQLSFYDSNNGYSWTRISNGTSTNSLVVIGELSPYIDFVSPKVLTTKGVVTINGERFSTSTPTVITLASNNVPCPVNFVCVGQVKTYNALSKDGTALSFIPNVDPGDYYLYVIDPKTGQSNSFAISLIKSSATLSVTPDQTKISSGQSVTLNYGVPDNALSSILYLYCPAGVVGNDETGKNICNMDVNFTTQITSSRITLLSTSTASQNVIPNFYVYYPDRPEFAVGVASQVTVVPNASVPVVIPVNRTATSTTTITPTPSPTGTPYVPPKNSTTPSTSPSRAGGGSANFQTSAIYVPPATPVVAPVIVPSPNPSPSVSIIPNVSPSNTPKPSSSSSPIGLAGYNYSFAAVLESLKSIFGF